MTDLIGLKIGTDNNMNIIDVPTKDRLNQLTKVF